METKRLFVDMDGTLAVFTSVDELEQLYEKGFFENAKPHINVVLAVNQIISDNTDIEVNILSAYLTDSKYALDEKNAWLDKFLPEIDQQHRIFVPCGANKRAYLPGGIKETDFLLDDYTNNLMLWQPPARGIKLVNGINNKRGTWKHDKIRYDEESDKLAADIVSIMRGKEKICEEGSGIKQPADLTGSDKYPPIEIIPIKNVGVANGYAKRRIEEGYILSNGIALLECEKDRNGFYYGGAGLDGMYLKTGNIYSPVKDQNGAITGFRQISKYASIFSKDELNLIDQYAAESKEKLLKDLQEILPVVKQQQVKNMIKNTLEKVSDIPEHDCVILMRDIKIEYTERCHQSIYEREKSVNKKNLEITL